MIENIQVQSITLNTLQYGNHLTLEVKRVTFAKISLLEKIYIIFIFKTCICLLKKIQKHCINLNLLSSL